MTPEQAIQRASTIRSRLTADMGNTLTSLRGSPELLLDELVQDAMHQVETLLGERINDVPEQEGRAVLIRDGAGNLVVGRQKP